jgi:hypothetical protein
LQFSVIDVAAVPHKLVKPGRFVPWAGLEFISNNDVIKERATVNN